MNIEIEREKLEHMLILLAVATFHTPALQAERTELVEAGLKSLAAPVQEPVAWVREHELPLAPGDAFSWVETFVHKTPLYTTPPAAKPAPVQPVANAKAIAECLAVLRPLVKRKFPQEQALEELAGYLATPPAAQRQWVGLTDEDLANCSGHEVRWALYWEKLLKEKNT